MFLEIFWIYHSSQRLSLRETVYRQLGELPVGGTSWNFLRREGIMIFSQDDLFLYFNDFILCHLRLKNKLNFYRLQDWKKIFRLRVKFFEPSPRLDFPQLAVFAFFLWHWEFESPNCHYTSRDKKGSLGWKKRITFIKIYVRL